MTTTTSAAVSAPPRPLARALASAHAAGLDLGPLTTPRVSYVGDPWNTGAPADVTLHVAGGCSLRNLTTVGTRLDQITAGLAAQARLCNKCQAPAAGTAGAWARAAGVLATSTDLREQVRELDDRRDDPALDLAEYAQSFGYAAAELGRTALTSWSAPRSSALEDLLAEAPGPDAPRDPALARFLDHVTDHVTETRRHWGALVARQPMEARLRRRCGPQMADTGPVWVLLLAQPLLLDGSESWADLVTFGKVAEMTPLAVGGGFAVVATGSHVPFPAEDTFAPIPGATAERLEYALTLWGDAARFDTAGFVDLLHAVITADTATTSTG